MTYLKKIGQTLQYFVLVTVCFFCCTLQAAIQDDLNNNLQFTQDGHLLQFDTDGIRLKATKTELHTKFINSTATTPFIQQSGSVAKPCGLFSRAYYTELWPGINVAYDTVDNAVIRSTWVLSAGARVADIRLQYNAPLTIDLDGQLRIHYGEDEIRESAPVAWQVIKGIVKHVDVAFQLLNDSEVGFNVAEYNEKYPLTIDPALEWNTFHGDIGSGFHNTIRESAAAMTVDASDNSYIAINRRDYFTPSEINSVYVIKLDAHGKLIWQSDVDSPGLSGFDEFNSVVGITQDSADNIYVLGHSTVTSGTPINPHTGDDLDDVYIIKYNPDGEIVWKTYSGGEGSDFAGDITVDKDDNIYLIGSSDNTWSIPLNPHSANSESDIFIQILNTDGGHVWHTFAGGDGADTGSGIHVDDLGNIYISGTSNTTWATPVRAYHASNDAFAARFNSDGVLIWNTFMGGLNADTSNALTVDSDGSLYMIGVSESGWGMLPVNVYNHGDDVFIVKINASGTKSWHTFIGGTGADYGSDIALDNENTIYITGSTSSGWVDNRTGIPIMMLDNNGKTIWHTTIAGNHFISDRANTIATGFTADFFIAGSNSQTWGSPINPYAGDIDALIVKFRSHNPQQEACDFYSFKSGNNKLVYVCL